MGTCKISGCDNPIWGGGVCKYHNYTRYMQGGDLHKRKSKAKDPIPRESKKRKIERKRYTEVCDLLTEEIRLANDGRVYCFFSGLEIIAKRPHYHHLQKRTGDYYTDKEWLVPALDEYHVEQYHQSTYEQRSKQPWWNGFLTRLKAKSEELYQKELRKKEKAEPINPQKGLFDDDDY